MARQAASPRDASQVVIDQFNQGQSLLAADVFRRWAVNFVENARGLTRANVASACSLTADELAGLLTGADPITIPVLMALRSGFSRLARQHNLAYRVPDFPDRNSCHVAGWLHALNEAGARHGVPAQLRPVGVMHYHCLRAMCGNDRWHLATARQSAPEFEQLAAQMFAEARAATTAVPEVLDRYQPGYALPQSAAALRQLMRYWYNPWRGVFNQLGDSQ